MAWRKLSVTGSLETGAVQDFSGVKIPATAPLISSGAASANVPLTRWPRAVSLRSATLSSASPAVEMTLAVVDAVYSRASPGVNGPNETGPPSVSERVAGTPPPTGSVTTGPSGKLASPGPQVRGM